MMPVKSSTIQELENYLASGVLDDIIVYVRRTDVSCLESPYVLWNIHFSGPCTVGCKNCHSKALWEPKPADRVSIASLLAEIIKLHASAQLIEGVAFMGTDSPIRATAATALVQPLKEMGLVSVVYTGLELSPAQLWYGTPDFFVTGPYVRGEWYEGKRFYRLGEQASMQYPAKYEEISMTDYFTR